MFNPVILASSSGGSFDTVVSAMDTVFTFAGKALSFCLDNPTLAIFFACSIVGAVVGVVAKLKSLSAG